jgi:hypothetical protein
MDGTDVEYHCPSLAWQKYFEEMEQKEKHHGRNPDAIFLQLVAWIRWFMRF